MKILLYVLMVCLVLPLALLSGYGVISTIIDSPIGPVPATLATLCCATAVVQAFRLGRRTRSELARLIAAIIMAAAVFLTGWLVTGEIPQGKPPPAG